jgi:hypothetical protein
MSGPTDRLIERLVADARPVRRLAPPTLRALLWLAAFALVAAVAVMLAADVGATLRRTAALTQRLSVLGELGVGVSAVIAACHVALPDRSPRWALAPIPFLLLWLVSSGLGCLALLPTLGVAGPDPGESRNCFVFMVAVSAPVGGALFLMLRRARPLREKLTAVLAALGVAAFAALLLRFFHPFEVTALDLGFHLAAALVVVGLGALAGRTALVGRP